MQIAGVDNPERTAIVHNLIEKMTVEAKFLLYVILNTPGELSSMIFNNKTDTSSDNEEKYKPHWVRKKNINKNIIRKYLKALDSSMEHETIYLCSKCDKTFSKAGIKCSCGGESRAESTGWKTKEINRAIFDIRQFLKNLERI